MKNDGNYAFSVTQINKYLKTLIESDDVMSAVWIRGEISNFKLHSSGHMYFTLKDDDAVIGAVMFKSSASRLKFMPKNGMRVVVSGSVRVYEKMGAYQVYVSAMKPDGVGDLHLEFERLKQQLFEEGLFDEDKKKPLPRFAEKIGIVTSPTGAAVRDMIKILTSRFPLAEIYVFPAQVQGEGADESIARAVAYFDKFTDVDVIITGRGGGSIEDLWAFNSCLLARTVFECKKPVISAVGHEIDFTICDFVSSRRAATPTDAAQIAVPDAKEVKQSLKITEKALKSALLSKLARRRGELESNSILRCARGVKADIQTKFLLTDEKYSALEKTMKQLLTDRRADAALAAGRLDTLSPLAVLSRGYSVAKKDGRSVKSVRALKCGDDIEIRFKDGAANAKIQKIIENG